MNINNCNETSFTSIVCEYDDRLRLCPFCKSEAWLMNVECSDGDILYNPQCFECGVMLKESYETKEEAITVWNR